MHRLFWPMTFLALHICALSSFAQSERIRRPEASPSPNGKLPELAWKVASFADAGISAEYGAWIAKTIPEVIQPGSWSQEGGVGRLCYNQAENVLVVYHTPAVHAQIESMVTLLTKAQPTGKTVPRPVPTVQAVPAPASLSSNLYPVAAISTVATTSLDVPPPPPPPMIAVPAKPAAPAKITVDNRPTAGKAPRHLIHVILDGFSYGMGAEESGVVKINNFTIRYEGDGFIDSNIVNLAKSISGGTAASVAQGLIRSDVAATPPQFSGAEENSLPVPPPPATLPFGASVTRTQTPAVSQMPALHPFPGTNSAKQQSPSPLMPPVK